MDWGSVDPKWADPGRTGIAKFRGFFVMFTVLSCTVDSADVLILDTDMEESFPIGRLQTFSWSAPLWTLARELS